MIASLALGAVLLQSSATIDRGPYGVPRITAPDAQAAYKAMGQAVAEDRLWQLELSRRTAQGQLAEILGPSAAASDTETLRRAYTAEELLQMFRQLPPEAQTAFQAYADGINQTIEERQAQNTLPPGYAQHQFEPRPWSVIDSCAVAVMMARRFGGGGAGELRNYAVWQYLKLRPVRDQALDVLDDLIWFNDPDSPVTVDRTDDPVLNRPVFALPTRADSERHLAVLPNTNLLELAGAVAIAEGQETALVAQTHGVPYKTGSYAVVVGPRRSATGNPILLAAPQMGHTNPAVVHEVGLTCPEFTVTGMNVPGIPGVIIGNTPDFAWTLTTGVADIEDVFVSELRDDDTYLHAGRPQTLEKITFTVKVKGAEDREVTQYRTVHGPVLLRSTSSKAVYSLKSSYWKRELASYAALFDLGKIKSVADVNQFSRRIPVNFNFFFAFKSGEIGYRYLGFVPIRAEGIDPRFPTPDTAANQWKGLIPPDQMPRVNDPGSGLILNWNNKPVAWWPNLDTPAWGALFRSELLAKALTAPRLSVQDVEAAARTIALQESNSNAAFMPFFRPSLEQQYGRAAAPGPARQLMSFTGWQTQGSVPATLYNETLRELRRAVFLPSLGNLTQDALFETAVQPSVIYRAMQGRTKYDWLNGKDPSEYVIQAYEQAVKNLETRRGPDPLAWGHLPGTMPDPNGPPVAYNNRGTYIQITELAPSGLHARAVVSPGIAEQGPHQSDQAPLARTWLYKQTYPWPSSGNNR